jgi:polyferredoxin
MNAFISTFILSGLVFISISAMSVEPGTAIDKWCNYISTTSIALNIFSLASIVVLIYKRKRRHCAKENEVIAPR